MRTKNESIKDGKGKADKQERDRISGSLELLSAMQITADMKGLDAESKTVLHSKEVLAVILQETVEEFKGYSVEEIMDFIEVREIKKSVDNKQLLV